MTILSSARAGLYRPTQAVKATIAASKNLRMSDLRRSLDALMAAPLLFVFFERAETWAICSFDELFDALIFPCPALEKRELIAFRRAVAQRGFEIGNEQQLGEKRSALASPGRG